ncbi:MAG: tRNA (adenosine(37)-N6)-threonylcarbamoyltransferase complex ATPase subunit type 1 TsaE [Prevotellaceae bacterium]|nr:tRNA (adenosine(37)-N6)-threonylcarbamoyltransferase complex ATPase subunit type 1 TsaE [Prevotellaceae bacterium]
MQIVIKSLNQIAAAAREFVSVIGTHRVFAFYGAMGAGKTTFIKAICAELGVQDVVNSPTFSIVNEYQDAAGNVIYHFDCYRIAKVQDALNIGAEEYLYSGNLCLIEWAENIADILPTNTVSVTIEVSENNERVVKVG